MSKERLIMYITARLNYMTERQLDSVLHFIKGLTCGTPER